MIELSASFEVGVGAQCRRLVFGVLGGVVELGIAEMVAAALVDVDAAGLAQAIDPEGRQETRGRIEAW